MNCFSCWDDAYKNCQMKISACCVVVRKWIGHGRQVLSVGILLSLWVTMLLLCDVLSQTSLWAKQTGYDPRTANKWAKLPLQLLNLSTNNRSSSVANMLAGEIESEKNDDIKIQGLYRGSVRKIESIGLEESNGGNLNLQQTTNGKTIPHDGRERNLTRIQNTKNSRFSSQATVGNHTYLIRSRCSRVKSRDDFSRCMQTIGYQVRQKHAHQQVNSRKQHATLPHQKNTSSFHDSFTADNSHKKNQISPHSNRVLTPHVDENNLDGALTSQVDGTSLGESGNSNSRDIDKETFLRLKQDGFLDYSYNVTASNRLDLNRALPDVRPHRWVMVTGYTSYMLQTCTTSALTANSVD